MDLWLFLTKTSIALYCSIKYIQQGIEEKEHRFIFFLLLYIFLSAASCLQKQNAIKKATLAASLTSAAAGSIYASYDLLLFLPVNVLEISKFSGLNIYIASALCFLPFAYFGFYNGAAEYLFIFVISLLILLLADKSYTRLKKLEDETDEIKTKFIEIQGSLSKSKNYETQLVYVSQLEERNSIAQRIHDKVGHTLAGSIIQLEAACAVLSKDTKKAEEIIKNIISVLSSGMDEIRQTLRDIKPSAEQIGINRLKVILDEFSARTGIETLLSHDDKIFCLDATQWRIICENATEFLTNSLKHSKCTKITVKIQIFSKIIKCEMKDNGKGAAAIVKGLGLKGMEDRCESAGGKMVIDGSQGFSAIMIFPRKEE